MDTMYWNLFWSTGMPEAWLMSRDGEGTHQKGPGAEPGVWQGLSGGALVRFGPRMPDIFPGGPGRIY